MARINRMEQTAASVPCEPHCIKEADLGRLDARIENNEKTGIEIKEALQRIVENHEKDKQTSTEQFTKITSEIASMSATMKQSAESTKELLENQNKLLGQLQQILLDNQSISNKESSLETALNTQSQIAEERHKKVKTALESLAARIVKLEQHKNTIVSIGALIISLLTAAGVIAQIFQTFHK